LRRARFAFERVQDRQGYFWKEARVNEELGHIMTDSFADCIAAYMLAIDRVASTIRTRGIYA
jgi:glutamate dehydrogenase (NAD(P)+)